jgi:hypothetical protein
MKNPFSSKPHVKILTAGVATEKGSSKASSKAGNILDNRIYPDIPFHKAKEYYKSIGRVQNVTDSFVWDIVNRGWYYDGNEALVEQMNTWEENMDMSDMLASMVRNWIICGVHIVSPKDWIPLQLGSLVAKRRDEFGNTTQYVQQINGVETYLNASDFLEIPFILLDRESWGIGLFHSLMFDKYIDIDGIDARPTLEYYRQIIQDESKVLHKIGAPRVIYKLPGASPETLDNDIIPLIEGMRPGDRMVINEEMDIVQEVVDGRTRFSDSVQHVIDEVDTGMQSSKNRLIAEPSAMADAKEAGQQDDDRILGIMEKVRMFINREMIPRILGTDAGEIEFKWGSKDTFDLIFPPAIQRAIELGVLNPQQAKEMLVDNFSWKIPEDTSTPVLPSVDPIEQEKLFLMKEARSKLNSI